MKDYREFAGRVDINSIAGLRRNHQRRELTRRDKNQPPQNKHPKPVAYDPQASPDSKMPDQYRPHVRFLLKDPSKVFEPQNLEIADEAKEHAHEEKDGGSVEPGAELERAGDDVAGVDVGEVGRVGSARNEPPDLVCAVRDETGEHKCREELH